MKKNNWSISNGDMGNWGIDLVFNDKDNIIEDMVQYIEKTLESIKDNFKVSQIEFPIVFITKGSEKREYERIKMNDFSKEDIITLINEIKKQYKYDYIRPSEIEINGLTKIYKYDDSGNIVTSWEPNLIEIGFFTEYDTKMQKYGFSIYTYADIWFPVTNDWKDNKKLSELNNPILTKIIKNTESAIDIKVNYFGSSAGWDDYPYATIDKHGFNIVDYNTINWRKYPYANHRRKMSELEDKE